MDVNMKFVETVERYAGPLRQFLSYIAVMGQAGADGISLDEARKILPADYARFCGFLMEQLD